MHPNEASTPELSVSDSTDTLVSLRVGQPELGASLELEPSSPTRDWLLWQLADSAFPTGGFAHSSGLEAAYQQGEVRGRDELRAFLETSLRQQFHFALPFVVGAHRKPEELRELDAWFDTLTSQPGNELAWAAVEALVAELPLAAFCFWIAFDAEAVAVARRFVGASAPSGPGEPTG